MGEIAEGLINGDFDFYTGEYLGPGGGIPRTSSRSLPWEKRNGKIGKHSDKENAYNGVKKYISQKWYGQDNIPSVRSLIYEYTGETNFDIKQKCVEIQQDFKKFAKWVNKKIKESK